jgi:hypothetical protein
VAKLSKESTDFLCIKLFAPFASLRLCVKSISEGVWLMKFTDGYWGFRSGVTPHFPVQVHDVVVEPDALVVYGPTRRLNHRGDTLNLGLLTVRFSSPMPDVIRVQLTHHKGQRPSAPTFALDSQPTPDLHIQTPPSP